MLARLLVAALCLLPMTAAAEGGFITEIGGGFKDLRTTSYLLQSGCVKAVVTEPIWPENPRGYHTYSCGGDNPVFVGWTIAYEWELPRGNRVRVGHFHLSQWFDNAGEVHLDCVCSSFTIRWGKKK
jgi:hypothetical protein